MNIETLMSDSPRVALVTLIGQAGEDSSSTNELAAEIQRELERAPVARSLVVDKVTVLDKSVKIPEKLTFA
jgi:hypothetical protein